MLLTVLGLAFLLRFGEADKELNATSKGIHVVTIATDANDGFLRFARSVRQVGLPLHVLGMGTPWSAVQPRKMLTDLLETVKHNEELIIVFTDSYDVVFTGGASALSTAFHHLGANIVFSADGTCWPDPHAASEYPPVKVNENRFLNSGGFIGYAPSLYRMLTTKIAAPPEVSGEHAYHGDQRYFTRLFLDPSVRDELDIKVDKRGEIFQNLHGALDDVKLEFKGAESYLYNNKTGNTPIIIHGNGPDKPVFNRLTNYLGGAFTFSQGCRRCAEDTISLEGVSDDELPVVFLALFLPVPVPFIEGFFQGVTDLDYPKSRMHLSIFYDEYHELEVLDVLAENRDEYRSVQVYGPSRQLTERSARDQALQDCVTVSCQYLFMLDSVAHLEDPQVLTHLIQSNRSVVAPLVSETHRMTSNFWGALREDGFYGAAPDYDDIVLNEIRGIWNVPYLRSAILLHGQRAEQLLGAFSLHPDLDSDMSFSKACRDKNIFMYVDNQGDYGHLINIDDFETNHVHNDLYTIISNPTDWEKKYINPEYHAQTEEDTVLEQPCTDVYWFPIATEQFCDELIAEAENADDWSKGIYRTPEDEEPGVEYDPVPTVDINMPQFGFEDGWMEFLKTYVVPINAKVYDGYNTETDVHNAFIVRYRPTEQSSLRPHHDTATYTVNLALNRYNEDYGGGGVRFTRYNCSVVNLKKGWMLMHPGKLTHQHEGLETTAGTRYIAVTFVDP